MTKNGAVVMRKKGKRTPFKIIGDLIKIKLPPETVPKPYTPEEHACITAMGGRITITKPVVAPSVSLVMSDKAGVGWKPDDRAAGQPILRKNALGAKLAPPKNQTGPSRELIIGLDFGTSSTKVVVADKSLNIGYAVPLVDAVGVNSYLLPSAMIETDDGFYMLAGEGHRHADLKLAMLENITDQIACARVCAFLALVIRSVRAWLYETKNDQYLNADILWTIALGQPTNPEESEAFSYQFKQLANVAWTLAAGRGDIRVKTALRIWHQREKLDLGDELEVRTMAELSAQIHGFVSSSHFDARQPNIYLMVDVGAGTVDASLFHVRKSGDGKVSFSLFTHSVEFFGAANLNRYRLNWWQLQLEKIANNISINNINYAKRANSIKKSLEKIKPPTEYRGRYPDNYSSHVKGVTVQYQGSAISPDQEFFSKIINQVSGQTLYRAKKNKLLLQDAIKDMPFFLCGGGSRHSFYNMLKTAIKETPNASWLSTKNRELILPANIVAPGLSVSDYDRLSVAYGLSMLNLGSSGAVPALESIRATEQNNDWISSTAEKSAC